MITYSLSTTTNCSPATTVHPQISYEEFSDQELVGRGVSGLVKKARWGGLTVAIKYLYDSREMPTELNNLNRVFGGEHIIRFYGHTTSNHGEMGIVMEYCANGTLHDYLNSNFHQFTWENKFDMAQEITRGLRFVHHQGLLHRDLHDGNILIDDGGHALIADFGLARPIVRDKTTGSVKGRMAFIPPERLRDEREPFTVQGDIYSLGIILWELTAGREPFHGMSSIAVGIAVLKDKRENPVDGTPKWYQEVYTACWASDPRNRPSTDLVVLFLTLQGQCCIHFIFTRCDQLLIY
jgi:serine/threonine protein kinase